MTCPRCIIVMGVTGRGKTTVGELLAARLNYEFLEGDSLHPARNIEAMQAGRPLDDAMRAPWLDAIAARMAQSSGLGVVASCSALKRSYRQRLAIDPATHFIHLALTPEQSRQRLTERKGHFMSVSLVESQFATLEPPTRTASFSTPLCRRRPPLKLQSPVSDEGERDCW